MSAISELASLNLLYLVLSLAVLILTIVISVLAINATLVIRDFRKISHTAGDITEKVHSMVLTPVSFVSRMSENLFPHLEDFIKSYLEKKKKSKKD